MDWYYDFSGEDYPTAVAAAAYAVQSNEESRLDSKSSNMMRSRTQKTETLPKQKNKSAVKFSDQHPKESFKDPETPTKIHEKKTHFSDTDESNSDEHYNSALERSHENSPSNGRPPTSADEHSDIGERKSPDTTRPKPVRSPMGRPIETRRQSRSKPSPGADAWEKEEMANINERKSLVITTTEKAAAFLPYTGRPVDTTRQGGSRPGPEDAMADAWEKEEMASINERYEDLRATIENWRIRKKKKADRKLEKIQAKLKKKKAEAAEMPPTERMRIEFKVDKRRAKAFTSHRDKISRIEEIAGGARAKAEQNRRNEELKVKEKANKIRATGKLPKTCLCF